MRIVLIGTRWFGAQMLSRLIEGGHELCVVATNGEDGFAEAARAAGLPLTVHDNPHRLGADDMPPGEWDVIVAAYSHAFIGAQARRTAKRAAIGYHPSLLPRHRGIAAVEWTIKQGDPIAGGSVYHLASGMDAGAIAAQDWCFVYPDDDAASLWRRALAPMGLRLLMQVVDEIDRTGSAPAHPQDERAATQAPALDPGS